MHKIAFKRKEKNMADIVRNSIHLSTYLQGEVASGSKVFIVTKNGLEKEIIVLQTLTLKKTRELAAMVILKKVLKLTENIYVLQIKIIH